MKRKRLPDSQHCRLGCSRIELLPHVLFFACDTRRCVVFTRYRDALPSLPNYDWFVCLRRTALRFYTHARAHKRPSELTRNHMSLERKGTGSHTLAARSSKVGHSRLADRQSDLRSVAFYHGVQPCILQQLGVGEVKGSAPATQHVCHNHVSVACCSNMPPRTA